MVDRTKREIVTVTTRFKVVPQTDALTGAPLAEYFEGSDKGDHWEMWCKRCNKGWSLKKPDPGKEVGVGNLLHLLNHARSHEGRR